MKQTIDEIAASLAARNPNYLFGISPDKGLVAIAVADHWHPVVSATITGSWIDVSAGLPLVNGQRVYEDSDFTAFTEAS